MDRPAALLSGEDRLSYEVIARKWRPKTFSDLVGQPHISQTLLNALENDRLPHALIFTGQRGTGKTSSARILAKSLRCPNSENFIPCGTCSECVEISTGSSIDVVEIDGASNNGVDAIRELRDSIGYMPSSGNKKIYIIDEVHMLTTSAFNALLKTLEEPPDHIVFIMATTEIHKIPNTILSRCQRFDFRRIPLRQICDRLKTICEAGNTNVNDEALWMIARQGDGSMRDSQSLLDQVITFSSGDISLEKVVEILGLTDRGLLTSTVEALINRDTQQIVDVIDRIFKAGYDPKIYVQDLLEELRHLLLIKLAPKKASQLVDLPESEINRLEELGNALGEEDVHLLFDMALKGANEIPRAQDPRVVLEMLLLRMSAAPRIASLAQLGSGVLPVARPPEQRAPQAKPQNVESQQKKTPAPPPPQEQLSKPVESHPPQQQTQHQKVSTTQPSPTARPPQAPSGNKDQDWSAFVQRVKSVNGLIAAKLQHSYLIELNSDKVVTIGIPPKMKFLFEQVQDNNFQKKINNYMTTFWGAGYSLEVQLGDEKKSQILTPKAIETKKVMSEKDSIREQVENHALIKSAQSAFKSEIRSIKEIS